MPQGAVGESTGNQVFFHSFIANIGLLMGPYLGTQCFGIGQRTLQKLVIQYRGDAACWRMSCCQTLRTLNEAVRFPPQFTAEGKMMPCSGLCGTVRSAWQRSILAAMTRRPWARVCCRMGESPRSWALQLRPDAAGSGAIGPPSHCSVH